MTGNFDLSLVALSMVALWIAVRLRARGSWSAFLPRSGFTRLFRGGTLLISFFGTRQTRGNAVQSDQLRASENQYRLLWEALGDAALLVDDRGQIEFANRALADVFGYAPSEVIGQNIAMLRPFDLRDALARYFARGVSSGAWRCSQSRGLHRNGHEFPLEIAYGCLVLGGRPRFAGLMRDISKRHQAENLLAGQKQVLEQIVAGLSLDATLAAIVLLLERQFPRTKGMALLLDDSGTHIARGVAPSLPQAYTDTLKGLAIGPDIGSCGAAAYRRELVVASDIASDPKWTDFRELALLYGLEACWSQPIISHDGELFGTLAMYMRHPGEPVASELDALLTVAPVAAIAIKRAQVEAQMRATNERFHLVARATQDAVCDWDLITRTAWWNDEYRKQFGHTLGAKPGIESWSDYLHPQEHERVLANIHTAINSGAATWTDEYRFRRHDGGYATVFGRAFIARDAHGRAVRMIGSMLDITERKRSEEQLAYLAQYDTLTSLPNRNLFQDRLGHALARADRNRGLVALIYVDLDRFKEINDTLGHTLGDKVLQTVATRLRACVRESDTVARLGGDEFTIILEDVSSADAVAQVARKVLDSLAPSMVIGERDIVITGSLGVTLYPHHGGTSEILVQQADMAMYQAKTEGRNNFQFYVAAMGVVASARLELEHSLRQALTCKEFVLYYQPIISLASGAITGVEALLRWQHPQWGLTAPGRFIEIAEASGLIVPLGEWVLNEACAQAAAWCGRGLPAVQISVNISARQLRNVDLLKVIGDALGRHGLQGQQLKLEITESLLMEKPQESARLLAAVKALGVAIAVDDFGTGYSSLAYLKHFPLDTLKIDQSFVRDVTTDISDATMVQAMIGLAHNLQLSLTAEGVETVEQLRFLHAHGCDTVQGYLFSRPLPAADFALLLEQGIAFDLIQPMAVGMDGAGIPADLTATRHAPVLAA